jgi:hypothetical protein
MVIVRIIDSEIIFEISSESVDLRRFYTIEYFNFLDIHPVIYVDRTNDIMAGGYFQDTDRLTVPYKYLVNFIENDKLVIENVGSYFKEKVNHLMTAIGVKGYKNVEKDYDTDESVEKYYDTDDTDDVDDVDEEEDYNAVDVDDVDDVKEEEDYNAVDVDDVDDVKEEENYNAVDVDDVDDVKEEEDYNAVDVDDVDDVKEEEDYNAVDVDDVDDVKEEENYNAVDADGSEEKYADDTSFVNDVSVDKDENMEKNEREESLKNNYNADDVDDVEHHNAVDADGSADDNNTDTSFVNDMSVGEDEEEREKIVEENENNVGTNVLNPPVVSGNSKKNSMKIKIKLENLDGMKNGNLKEIMAHNILHDNENVEMNSDGLTYTDVENLYKIMWFLKMEVDIDEVYRVNGRFLVIKEHFEPPKSNIRGLDISMMKNTLLTKYLQ